MKENVEYIKVFADYESDDMPVVYLYEVDLEDERLALRAIEIFADRKVKCIEDFYRDVIEILSIPSVAELNSGEWGGGFFALAIREEEFEEIICRVAFGIFGSLSTVCVQCRRWMDQVE